MAAQPTLLQGQPKDLGGGFTVRRLLPQARQRSVGPFVFFDHFGPVTVAPGERHDVRPHPHIGLATVTYLFDGAIHHRDSLGSGQQISPGAINWMTAGRGIVHSERRPDALENTTLTNHGLQLWVALPKELEECEPAFEHTAADAIPSFSRGGHAVRVLVGEAFGARSPVKAFSNIVYLDVTLAPGETFELPALAQELGVYPIDGDVAIDGAAVPKHELAVIAPGQGATLTAERPTRIAVVGGDALDGPRFLWWNFVSSRRERIVQAADDWRNRRFAAIPGDDSEFIPLPEDRPLPAAPPQASQESVPGKI